MNLFFFSLIELSFFFEPLLNMTNRVEGFFSLTQRIELFFAWLTELNLFFFLRIMTHRIEPLFMTYRIEPLFMTHRIERLFEFDSKNWISFWVWLKESNFFEAKKTHRIEPFFSLTEVNPSFQYAKNKTGFLEYDSKNWERILSKMTRRIELFLEEWLKELNIVSKGKTQRVELFILK